MGVIHLDRLRDTVRVRRSLPEAAECRRLRCRAQLTRAEIALAISVSEKTVARWERNERKPRPTNAEKYAAVIAVIQSALEER